jgi:hypothetical protein
MSDDQNLTPSAKIIKKSNEIKTCKDSLGRVIAYKSLKPSDQLEMVSIIGTDRALNMIAISMCSASYRASAIDGIPLFSPETYQDLKDNMDTLGDEGLSALYDAFREPKAGDPKIDEKKKIKE